MTEEQIHEFVTKHRGLQMVCGNCGALIRFPIRCGDHFCDPCIRKRKGLLINELDPVVAEMQEPHFLTLTQRRKKLSKKGVKTLRGAFTKLRHRDVWLNVFSGFYNIEVGSIDENLECNLHIHILYDGFDIYQPYLSWIWSQLVDGYIVYIEKCRNSDDAMRYLTKHFAKAVPEGGLSPESKAQINWILKRSKLVQGFGTTRFLRKKTEKNKEPIACPQCGSIHTLVSPYDPLYYDVLREVEDLEYAHQPA